ncbi:MAG: transposase [Methanosarcinaceae archaeon]
MNKKNKTIYLTDKFDFYETEISETMVKRRKRNLPHWEMDNAVYFITFRLANSIPLAVIKNLREEFQRQLKTELRKPGKVNSNQVYNLRLDFLFKIDHYLDNNIHVRYLSNPKVARIVQDSILFFAVIYAHEVTNFYDYANIQVIENLTNQAINDEMRYIIYRWSIMPNHVHLLIRPLINPVTRNFFSLSKILHSMKSYSANLANSILNRKGQFWHRESYDHIIRNQDEFNRIWAYIDNNAVKAGLIDSSEKWQGGSEYYLRQIKRLDSCSR